MFTYLSHKNKDAITVKMRLIDKESDDKSGLFLLRDNRTLEVNEIQLVIKPKSDISESIREGIAQLVNDYYENEIEDSLHLEYGDEFNDYITAIIDGLHYGDYVFDRYASKVTSRDLSISGITINSDIKRYINFNIAQDIVRDLVNTPGSDLTPEIYVNSIKRFFLSDIENYDNVTKQEKFREIKSLTTDSYYDQTFYEIKLPTGVVRLEFFKDNVLVDGLGYNGINAVGKGSSNDSYMVEMRWLPNSDRLITNEHYVLVGKGVTFDTGGISLKPSESMWEMKSDMAGSATVYGAFIAAILNESRVKTSAILCLAENRPGNGSVLPGDIFTAANGKTIMVDNTDAEGRLVLTDGLHHAGKIGASHIIDVATLTGAVVGALGTKIAGAFTDDKKLISALINCGEMFGESYWHLPLGKEEYRDQLDDDVADIKNLGGKPGASTAALFLQEFVPDDTKWMHIDIAGPAFTTSKWKYFRSGATGFGTKTLALLSMASFTHHDVNVE